MPLRALNNAAHEASSTAYIQKHTLGNTNTDKHVTSKDETYIVVDRSQTPPGLWGQMALSRVKWGGAVTSAPRRLSAKPASRA